MKQCHPILQASVRNTTRRTSSLEVPSPAPPSHRNCGLSSAGNPAAGAGSHKRPERRACGTFRRRHSILAVGGSIRTEVNSALHEPIPLPIQSTGTRGVAAKGAGSGSREALMGWILVPRSPFADCRAHHLSRAFARETHFSPKRFATSCPRVPLAHPA